MHMASGRELLAVTDAALQSLLAGGGASGSQEGLNLSDPVEFMAVLSLNSNPAWGASRIYM